MFDKLTDREKILAKAVLALVPITILFLGIFSVINRYKAHQDKYASLGQELSKEKDREFDALCAEQRRSYYNNVSLSPQIDDAGNEYVDWLKGMLDESNLSFSNIKPKDGSPLKADRKVIGNTKRYSFSTKGKLGDLTNFLTKFYQVDTLHKIKALNIKPITEKARGGKQVRTGELGISMTIEIASLTTADDNPDFAKNLRELYRPAEEYRKNILFRDIFGPPNNTPSVSARPSSSYTSMMRASVNVTGKDADERNKLKFEVVESEIEGVKLVPSSNGRTAKLNVPGQKAGEYKFRLRVVDDGNPPKENFADVKVRFKDKVVKVEKKEDPPPPKPYWPHAQQAKITSIVRSTSGEWEVWIKVPTLGDFHQLVEGESFKLDKKQWTVKSIAPHSAVLQVDGKLLTFKELTTFDKPDDEEVLKVKASEPARKEALNGVPAGAAGLPAKMESDAAPVPRN